MTNSIAIGLGLVILAALAANFWLDLDAHIFLGRKFAELVHWVAFWR